MPKASRLDRISLLILLIASCLLAVHAQQAFEMPPPPHIEEGIVFGLAAMILFSLTAFLADRWLGRIPEITDFPTAPHYVALPVGGPFWHNLVTTLRAHLARVALAALAVFLSLLMVSGLNQEVLCDCEPLFWMWIGSIGLLVIAFAPRPRLRWPARAWWQSHAWLLIAVGLIGLVALGLRVINLGHIPIDMGGDEGSQGVEALKILRGEIRNPFITSWLSVPTLSFYFNALTIQWLGNTAFALRLPWALIGTATVLIMFALTRRLKGLALGLMAATLLAAYHYHIHFSRLGSNQVADAFFMAAAFLFLYRAYDEGGLFNWVLAGVVAGLAQYFYAGARFTTLMVGVTVVSFIVRDWRTFLRAQWQGVIVLAVAFLITAAPMIQYAIVNPDEYNGRLNSVGIYQSGWMELAKRVTGQSEAELLLDQFKRAVLSYNYYPDRTVWYGSPHAFFDGAWAVLFILGLGYATLRPLDRRLFPMLIWWWGAILIGGMLTESPPSSQRLITSAPPAVFFVALALFKIGQIIQRLLPTVSVRRALVVLGALAVIALSWISTTWYFTIYTPQRYYGDWTAVTATEIMHYVEDRLDQSWHVVFLGAPNMYINFGSIPFLMPNLNRTDLVNPLTAPINPARFPANENLVFIALPQRAGELEYVQQTYPNGETHVIANPVPGKSEPLFTAYEVKAH